MGDSGTPSRKFMTRKEAADYISRTYFKVTPRTMQVWVSFQEGPPYRRIGGHAHYTKADIDAWVDSPTHNGKVAPRRVSPLGALGQK